MSNLVYYNAGDVIFRQNFPGDHAYIIQSGEVEVYNEENDRSETHLAVLGPGEMFGEVALLDDVPRTASVRALSDVTLQIVDL